MTNVTVRAIDSSVKDEFLDLHIATD